MGRQGPGHKRPPPEEADNRRRYPFSNWLRFLGAGALTRVCLWACWDSHGRRMKQVGGFGLVCCCDVCICKEVVGGVIAMGETNTPRSRVQMGRAEYSKYK